VQLTLTPVRGSQKVVNSVSPSASRRFPAQKTKGHDG
jgi:hypothetical protein